VLVSHYMERSLTSGSGTLRIRREHVRNLAAARAVRVDRSPYRPSPSFNDWIPVICLLVLIGVVVVGGLLILFAWVTTTLPGSARIACPYLHDCVVPGGTQSLPGEDEQLHEPKLTP
jgi:hypothetical protein